MNTKETTVDEIIVRSLSNFGSHMNGDKYRQEFKSQLKQLLLEKMPEEQGFGDYDKHVHIYIFENRGKCEVCGLSWKKSEVTVAYNQALREVIKVINELFK